MVKVSIGLSLLLLVTCLTWLHPDGFAGTSEQLYGLADLETLVQERSPLVKAAEERLASARAEIERIRYLHGPEFVFRAGNETEDRTEGTSTLGDLKSRASGRLEQDLVKLFRIRPLKRDEAIAEQEVAQAELAESRAKALSDLRQVYLEGLEEKLQAEGYGRIAGINEELLEIRQKRYKSSEGLPSDVLKAEKELTSSKALQRRHAAFFSTVRQTLAQSLEVAPDKIDFRKPQLPPLAEEAHFLTAVPENRPFVRKYEARARQEVSRGAMSGMENVRLYPYVGYHFDETVSGSRNGPEVGVVFSIPIFAGKIRERGLERFKHLEQGWKLEGRQVAEDVKKQIRFAYRRLELEDSRMADASRAVDLRQSEIKIEKARLESPIASVPADVAKVLELEAEAARSRLELDLAEVKKAAAYFELLYFAGLDGVTPQDRDKAEKSEEKPGPKALWVWKTERLLKEGPKRRFLLDACRAKKVDRIYLSVNRALMETFPANPHLAGLISELHRTGTAVSALIGESNWVYPAKRAQLAEFLEKIAAYNRMRGSGERFDSLHLDIEPQALKEWKSGNGDEKQKLLALFLETCMEVRARMPGMGENVELEVDIPLSFDKISSASLDGIAAAADTVVLMAYQIKDREKLTGAMREEIDAVGRGGGRFVVGLRARDFANEAELDRFVSGMQERLHGSPGFGGFAVHDCDQYRNLVTR